LADNIINTILTFQPQLVEARTCQKRGESFSGADDGNEGSIRHFLLFLLPSKAAGETYVMKQKTGK